MIAVIQKYKVMIIILSILVFLVLAWFVLLKPHTNKIPSRGVFVMQTGLVKSK